MYSLQYKHEYLHASTYFAGIAAQLILTHEHFNRQMLNIHANKKL